MKKIVLVETKSTYIHVYSHVPIPRVGSVLLGTILRDLGYDVKVYVEELEEVNFREFLDADLVGISTLTSTAPRSYHLAKIAREASIPIVLGGTHPTFEPEECLNHADFLVRGEGEETLVELIRCIEQKGDFSKILGLSYWQDGQQVHNPPRPLKEELDGYPIPDFTMVEGNAKHSIVSIVTGRGCPFDCTFCSVPAFNGKGYRGLSIDKVLKEIEYHMSRFDLSFLFFADDIFNYNKKRTKEILKGMIENKLTPNWGAQVRHEASRDPELLELMKKANCDRVFVGFESINPKTLELFHKKETVENIQNAIQSFHKKGIKIHGMFVVGSDEDTVETIRETRRFVEKWDVDSIQFMILTPIPGSHDYKQFRTSGRKFLTDDWTLFDGHHVVHVPRSITPYELQVETLTAMKNFYSLKSAFKRAVRGDFYEAGLRLTAHQLLKNWFKINDNYIQQLKTDLYKEVKELAGQEPVRKMGIIAIADIAASASVKQTLETFFQELGVKVESSIKGLGELVTERQEQLAQGKEKLAKIVYDYMESLKGKVDYVILPTVVDLEEYPSKLLASVEEVAKAIKSTVTSLPNVIQVQADMKSKSLQQSLTQIGLIFTDDLNKIRRACSKALTLA
jgi:radical SAM superfamily enzyme YgiQ (UPF0313 family)